MFFWSYLMPPEIFFEFIKDATAMVVAVLALLVALSVIWKN